MTMSASLPTSATATAGRGWAYLGTILGGTVSIAANVAHSYVASDDPAPLAVAFSVFWPVALFVGVEMLARVAWPTGRRWAALRFGGLLPVAAVAALVSYRHLSGLLAYYGEDTVTATVGPLAVDGLMLMATGALLATGRRTATTATATAPVVTPPATVPAPTTPAPTARPRPAVAVPAGVADDTAEKVAALLAERPSAAGGHGGHRPRWTG